MWDELLKNSNVISFDKKASEHCHCELDESTEDVRTVITKSGPRIFYVCCDCLKKRGFIW